MRELASQFDIRPHQVIHIFWTLAVWHFRNSCSSVRLWSKIDLTGIIYLSCEISLIHFYLDFLDDEKDFEYQRIVARMSDFYKEFVPLFADPGTNPDGTRKNRICVRLFL